MKINKNVDTQQKSKNIQSNIKEMEDKYLRALADYQNLERRTDQIIKNVSKDVQNNILLRFLDILDDVEKAEIFIKDRGLQIIKDRMVSVFQEYGVKEMDIKDKPYDPHLAEAVGIIPSKKEGIVLEVQRKGYMLQDEVLRHALVLVGKAQSQN